MAAADPVWQKTLDALKTQLNGMRADDVLLPQGVREAFAQIDLSQWSSDRKVFTFGQLDVDKMIPLCREGLVPWWCPFTGAIYKGDLAAVKKIQKAFEQDLGKGEKPNMSSALTWIVYPHKISDGFSNAIEPKVIRQLLAWGADANYENGKWLEFALRNLDAEGIRPFLDYGAQSGAILRVMDDLQKNQKFAQLGKIQDALAHCSYVKVDDQTLLEAKYIPDARGCSVFKTLFNFRSRRVHELYETGQGAQAVMNAMPFEEYDSEALAYAQEKLQQLGGKPRPLGERLDKPAKPASLKGLQNGG
ncbi:MAG: hypothetical protein EPN97_15275 [Alphaproteobacteria bacterium]|nr:MAG: hypothetical protein EPN97_15275 [Alphaproteobacteria bacterium]